MRTPSGTQKNRSCRSNPRIAHGPMGGRGSRMAVSSSAFTWRQLRCLSGSCSMIGPSLRHGSYIRAWRKHGGSTEEAWSSSGRRGSGAQCWKVQRRLYCSRAVGPSHRRRGQSNASPPEPAPLNDSFRAESAFQKGITGAPQWPQFGLPRCGARRFIPPIGGVAFAANALPPPYG